MTRLLPAPGAALLLQPRAVEEASNVADRSSRLVVHLDCGGHWVPLPAGDAAGQAQAGVMSVDGYGERQARHVPGAGGQLCSGRRGERLTRDFTASIIL